MEMKCPKCGYGCYDGKDVAKEEASFKEFDKKLIISKEQAIKHFSEELIGLFIDTAKPITNFFGIDVCVTSEKIKEGLLFGIKPGMSI